METNIDDQNDIPTRMFIFSEVALAVMVTIYVLLWAIRYFHVDPGTIGKGLAGMFGILIVLYMGYTPMIGLVCLWSYWMPRLINGHQVEMGKAGWARFGVNMLCWFLLLRATYNAVELSVSVEPP